jgi:hypothetical protein
MSVSQTCGVDSAIRVLDSWLLEQNYPPRGRTSIAEYIRAEGTLGGLVEALLIDPEDYERAEAIYIESLPAVLGVDPAWADEGVWLDSQSIFAAFDSACERWAGPDAPRFSDRAAARRDADRRDFEQWLASVDADYPPADQEEDGMSFPRTATRQERIAFYLSFHLGHGDA